jgi:N-methylhydantoinase A
MTWHIGTDIGGTFTDIVALQAITGETRTAKVPSRPDAPVDAMLDAIAALGLDPADVTRFVHGTTRVTNAIVQDRLPPIALIATAGFEDVLEVGRYRRRDLYDLSIPPKAPPLVPHTRCFGLHERLDHHGAVVQAPTQDALDRMVEWVRTTGVDSVAVCLLHAYANPEHERLVADRLRAIVPHISLSHEVNPEAREYERASSTAYNAAAMPIAADYLSELERRLPLGPGLQVFHSAGGMVSTTAAKRRPIVMAMSGPAAGVAASVQIARALGLPRVLTFDMGGTTTDVCLIVDGQAAMTDTRMTGDRPLRQPMLAVQSIGAGGGSIVRHGPGGLTVGPTSAGVEPGPACYGRGGTQPTITDANAVLGYLDPDARLGDRIAIDISRAEAAIAPIAAALGLDIVDTALGIVQVANATMARALRRVTVERGIDGRDCTLLAFGGGGPMHATGLADLYGLPGIVVPAVSSAFSALGCLTADQSFMQQRTVRLPLDGLDLPGFATTLAALSDTATAPLLAAGAPAATIDLTHVAMVRYEAQSDTTAVPFTLPLDPATLHRDFQANHQQLFGYTTTEPCIVEGLRIEARVPSGASVAFKPAAGGAPPTSRRCSFPGARAIDTAIIARDGLGDTTVGPAIITDRWSTVIVPPGWQARPDAAGNLFLARAA